MPGEVEQKFNIGLVKATVWKNTSGNGSVFRSVSLSKSYQKDGEWKNTSSLGANDLDKAIGVLEQARDYLNSAAADEEVIP